MNGTYVTYRASLPPDMSSLRRCQKEAKLEPLQGDFGSRRVGIHAPVDAVAGFRQHRGQHR